jgi:nucleotide-binding universal stress UspA family protein
VLAGIAQPPGSSILVIVNDASSAQGLLAWARHQAGRRHSRINVLYVPAFPDADGRILDPGMIEQGQKELTGSLDYLDSGPGFDLCIGDPEDSTIGAIRAKGLQDPHGLVMVGPLEVDSLVRLVFGSKLFEGGGLDLPLVVVPHSARSTALPRSTRSRLTLGYHGSDQAAGALAWAVAEANRRKGDVRAVMAWCEGDYGGVGGPVSIMPHPSSLVAPSADKLIADSLSRCGVPTDRVCAIARRGMPGSLLIQEATGSDLLVVSAGQTTVFGHRTLGAVTLACLTRSPVPVVIVPSHTSGDARRSRPEFGK